MWKIVVDFDLFLNCQLQIIEYGPLETELLSLIEPALVEGGGQVKITDKRITNLDRAFGARISYEVRLCIHFSL